MIEVDLADHAATEQLGGAVGAHLGPGDVVLLSGELGTGKTTFTRGLVRRLGGGDVVTSPTFTLCHTYATTPPVVHVDCWRLEDAIEFVDLALEEYLDDGSCVVAEWGEKVERFIGADALQIEFTYRGDHRAAALSATGDRSVTLLEVIAKGLSDQ